MPWYDAAIRQAPRGFSPAQRQFLVRAAAHPGLAEFEVLGRAAAMDFGGAANVLPFPEGLVSAQINIMRVAPIRSAAYASMAQAALDLAQGRRASAEGRIRGAMGAGFVLADGTTVLENLIGVVIINIANRSLTAFSDATGRSDQARTLMALSEPPDTVDPMAIVRGDASLRAQIAAMRASVTEPRLPRGMRWEFAIFTLAYEPCADLHQLVFGPYPAYYGTLAEGRRDLVRTTSDSMLFALGERALEHPAPWTGFSVDVSLRLARLVARGLDRVVGGRRFESCIAVLPVGFW